MDEILWVESIWVDGGWVNIVGVDGGCVDWISVEEIWVDGVRVDGGNVWISSLHPETLLPTPSNATQKLKELKFEKLLL